MAHYLIQSSRHPNGAFDITLLQGLVATQEKQIDDICTLLVISSIARPEMDTHFKDSFAYGLAVTEIAMFGRSDAKNDTGAPYFIFQAGKLIIELLGAFKGVHASQCIQKDTDMQYRQGYSVF